MPHLSIRHQSRMVTLQSLYEWDFDEEKDIKEILNRNITNSGFKVDQDFCFKIIDGVTKNLKEINNLIKKTAPEWPLEQIAGIDRAILRIGIFELVLDKEVPPKAVINEAVELGKEFGGENSGKFINGVLGTIYRSSERYEEEEEIVSSGAIIYSDEPDEKERNKFLLIKDKYDKWTFPKTKVGEEETWQEAIARKARSALGIEKAEIVGEIGEAKYTDKNEGKNIKKSVHFYLIKTEQKDSEVEKETNIRGIKWMDMEEAREKIDYPNLKDIFKKALELIK